MAQDGSKASMTSSAKSGAFLIIGRARRWRRFRRGPGTHHPITEGRVPKYPVDYPSLERAAAEVLPSFVYSYVAGGCGDERTQRANVDAFSRCAIVPRMLVGATERDLSVSLFDMKLPTPLFMCPIGVIGLCAQDFHGDIQVAKASAQTGVPMVASTLTQDRMEDVVPHAEGAPGIFQLYTPNDKDLAASFLARAERAGYRAVVVTLDTWTIGWRPRDLNAGNFPQLRGYVLENYFTDDVFLKRLAKSPKEDLKTAALEWIKCGATRCAGTICAGCAH
jgi:lactate 2-monooxygenase